MGWKSDPLWAALAAMRIEPAGAALGFGAKLAQENGWSAGHAEAVVEEYRRFLYLAATAREPVTPSEDVDRAWHLHLTYSRHYWDMLCGRILARPLHHDPGEGGPAERARHARQYRSTLARYRAELGEAPPASIWPDPDHGAAPRWPRRAARALAAAAALVTACAALAADASARHHGGLAGAAAGIGLAAICALAIAASFRAWPQSRGGGRGSGGCGGGWGGGDGGHGCCGGHGGCGGGGCGGCGS